MRAVQDGEQQVQVSKLPALLQRAQEPGAPRDARVRTRPAVHVPALWLQQAPAQRAEEASGAEAPGGARQVAAARLARLARLAQVARTPDPSALCNPIFLFMVLRLYEPCILMFCFDEVIDIFRAIKRLHLPAGVSFAPRPPQPLWEDNFTENRSLGLCMFA